MPFGRNKDAASQVSWGYNWYLAPNAGFNTNLEFIPTLFNSASNLLSVWSVKAQAAIDAGATALFSFNEPDVCWDGSACMTIADSVKTYKNYMQPFKGKALLGAPAVTNAGSPSGLTYLQNFLGNCTGCHVDFINVHWYSNKYAGATYFEWYINQVRKVAGGRPIWVTEYGLTNENPYTQAELQSFLKTSMSWMDQQSDIARYAYFMDAPGIMINSNGKGMSGTGVVYNSYKNATKQPYIGG